MADQSSSEEKTEDATPKKLREARKKGQVAKSRDLNTIVILIAAFLGMAVFVGYIGDYLLTTMRDCFSIATLESPRTSDVLNLAKGAFDNLAWSMMPYLGFVTVIAIAVSFLQTGPIFSAEPVKPQMKRMNIVENIKNMAKITTLIELVKNAAKLFVVFFIAYLVIKDSLQAILLTMTSTPLQSAAVAGEVLMAFFIRVFICFAIIAVLDLAVQRWNFHKQLRMTKDEVKREFKQDEGDPMIKSARREQHRELAMGDTRTAVAASDMVVTNPTHVAVALKYDDQGMVAPTVMAKGQRLYAQFIREIAEEHGVPIMQNVPLAWALLELEIGDEIPETLYPAVAELLLIVYRLQQGKAPDTVR